MEKIYKYKNIKDKNSEAAIVRVGDMVRTNVGFVGIIDNLCNDTAFVTIPAHYCNIKGEGLKLVMDANNLIKYM